MDPKTLFKKARRALRTKEYALAESLCADLLVAQPAFVPAHQLLCRVYLALGDREKTTELLGRRDQLPIDRHYAGWGAIAEQLEAIDLAEEIYKTHLQHTPQHPGALYRLAMLCIDKGQNTQAIDLLVAASRAAPDFAPAFTELGRCYAEDHCWGLAIEAYRHALTLTPDDEETKAALALAQDQVHSLSALPQEQPAEITAVAADLLRLFSGRENVHARQWIDAEGRVGYSPVHEPLTEALLNMHVRGEVTLGVYPLRADHTVLFGAIDIDIRKSALNAAGGKPDGDLTEHVRRDTVRLKRYFDHLKIPVYIEDSGYKGAHIWLFFAEPVPAGQVKGFLEAIIQRTGPPSDPLQWEVFPKQETVEPDKLGNLIKIPLGIHLKTRRRCVFTDAEGQVWADQYAAVQRIAPVPRARLDAAIDQLFQNSSTEVAVPDQAVVQPVPQEFVGLFDQCAVLKALKEKAETTHHLEHTERMVIKCILAHAGEAGQSLIHGIIGHCLDYSSKITQQQIDRTPPHPISCPKIRQRLPQVTSTVNCACHFELPEGGYPSPILHLDKDFTRGRAQKTDRHSELIGRYVTLRRDMQRLRTELNRIEDDLRYALALNDNEALHADGWILRRGEEEQLRVEVELA